MTPIRHINELLQAVKIQTKITVQIHLHSILVELLDKTMHQPHAPSELKIIEIQIHKVNQRIDDLTKELERL